MRKFYEDPIFEINKFYFEEILADGMLRPSDPEGDLDEDGDDFEEPDW